jgi:hypothetical protein
VSGVRGMYRAIPEVASPCKRLISFLWPEKSISALFKMNYMKSYIAFINPMLSTAVWGRAEMVVSGPVRLVNLAGNIRKA